MAMPDEALVYVVDDDQGMLESTVWLLESVGLKARPFTQGLDFLDACEGGRHAEENGGEDVAFHDDLRFSLGMSLG